MRAVVVTAENVVGVEDRPDPVAGPNALVRVERAGLCGTDVKILRNAIPVEWPRVIGHEIVGRVELSGGRGLVSEGTRVLVDPSLACGHCWLCRNDRGHLCRDGALLGRDVDGGCAELIAVAEEQLHPIPGTVSDDAAALLQVLSTCVHAQEAVPVLPGQSAAVVGLGVAGLLQLQLLRLRGVEPLIGVTRSAWKHKLAMHLGATVVVGPEEAETVTAELTAGRGVDLSVECAGTEQTLRQSMRLAGPGGTVLVFGITAPQADALPTYEWYFKELTILNPRAARPRDVERAIGLAENALLLEPLLTASFPLDQAAEALRACAEPDQLKVVLEVSS